MSPHLSLYVILHFYKEGFLFIEGSRKPGVWRAQYMLDPRGMLVAALQSTKLPYKDLWAKEPAQKPFPQQCYNDPCLSQMLNLKWLSTPLWAFKSSPLPAIAIAS